jgi:hypothetical protein
MRRETRSLLKPHLSSASSNIGSESHFSPSCSAAYPLENPLTVHCNILRRVDSDPYFVALHVGMNSACSSKLFESAYSL